MGALLLQSFVSLMLVGAGVLLYLYVHNARTFEHSDRLALLPLDDAEPKKTFDSSETPKDNS